MTLALTLLFAVNLYARVFGEEEKGETAKRVRRADSHKHDSTSESTRRGVARLRPH